MWFFKTEVGIVGSILVLELVAFNVFTVYHVHHHLHGKVRISGVIFLNIVITILTLAVWIASGFIRVYWKRWRGKPLY
jgi:hypothetical protein